MKTIKLIYVNETNQKIPSTIFSDILMQLQPVSLTQLTILPHKKEVELLLTDNKKIQFLNKTYRKKDMPTDVLSFAFEEGPSLGQIVISLERTKEQAKEIGHSTEEELRFLFVHGLLHLLGFDHQTAQEEKIMLAHAYKILGRTLNRMKS